MYINSRRAVSFFCGTQFLQHGGVMEKIKGGLVLIRIHG